MSKPLFGYLIVAGLTAMPLPAQDIAMTGRRVDSTLRASITALDSLRAYRKARPVRYDYSDSLVIGNGKVKVYFNANVAELARPGVVEADKHLVDLGTALDRIQPMVFSVVPDTALTPYDKQLGRFSTLNVRYHNASSPMNPNRTSVESDPKSIAGVILSQVSSRMNGIAQSEIGHWISGSVPMASDLAPPEDWGALRLAIVSSPSHTGRSCFRGDLKACRLYLGLDSVPDPAMALFDSTGRRLIVKYELGGSMLASAVATPRCLDGNDDACVAVLRLRRSTPVLSSPFVRTSVVTLALKLGGSRSAERLLTTRGTVGDALAGAANRPLDSLVADWQHHVNERSGSASNLRLTIAIWSLVWITACLVLALRSSRWR